MGRGLGRDFSHGISSMTLHTFRVVGAGQGTWGGV